MKSRPTTPRLLRGAVAVLATAVTLHAASSPSSSPSSSGDQPVKLEEVEVTGSRIRGLLSDAAVQPTMILTAEEIERTGAATLADAFRYVPEITSYTEGQFVHSPNAFGALSGDSTSARVTVNLRGAPAGGTLLLINGRRAPRNGQESGQDGYDLSGIPLAAVERVEVLLDGASAIYGSDAVGGVVNVILKRGYKRTDVRFSYEDSFEPDAHMMTASLSHGFAQGKWSGMITLNVEQAGSLMWSDRDFLKTLDRRPWGGINSLSTTVPSLNGSITVPAGNTAGLPANTVLTIPRGANGTNKTVADYVAAGAVPPPTDMAWFASYNSPYQRRSLSSLAEYEFRPWLTGFAEFRANRSETTIQGSPLWVNSFSVPANAPGNIFGVPVTMRRILIDQSPVVRVARTSSYSGVLGLRARLPHDWRFESSISRTYSQPEYRDPVGSTADATRFAAAIAHADAAKRPNLFYDALTPGANPNAPGVLDTIGGAYSTLEKATVWTYEAKADGPVARLWAGDLRAALGAEYREEYVKFPLQVPTDLFGARARPRFVTGVYAEARLPLLSERQKIPLVNRLEISAAGRADHYQEFAGATKPRYGGLYRPFKWLVFRGSYGEGYKLPTLSQLYAPARQTTGSIGGSGLLDIYRGNQPFIGPQLLLTGGNPNLVPEESESRTAGAVFEVPGRIFKGLSFSWDFYDHQYLNRIAAISLADRLLLFPEMFQRQPNLPTDPPGWPGPFGPVLTYDGRSMNISINRITGWDAGVKYYRTTPLGSFTLSYHASRTYRNENRTKPGAPLATNSVSDAFPMKMSGGLQWRKGAYETGALASYRAPLRRTITERRTPSAIRWDWRGSVDFGKLGWASASSERWYRRWLSDTKVALALFNVLDEIPPMNSVGMPDSTIVDPRGMRYSISLSKAFGGGDASIPVRR
jgi:iron complex outermembrane receptor protein